MLAVRTVGSRALLVEVVDTAGALDLAVWARHALPGLGVGVEEVVPAAVTVLFDGVSDLAALGAALDSWRPSGTPAAGPLVEIPVVYDGPDLDDVARRWGCSVEEAVDRHTSLELVSAFCGFAPGFAYLAGLPPELSVPRLDTPRPRVPAGAVAVADTWCGVYPTTSPGGWRLLGTTSVTLWDASATDPALLAPGTRVRFVRAP